MTEILINQSVAILCDGNNIERSIHGMSKSTKAMINFDELIPKLLNGRGLNRLIYFREGKSISKKFAGGGPPLLFTKISASRQLETRFSLPSSELRSATT